MSEKRKSPKDSGNDPDDLHPLEEAGIEDAHVDPEENTELPHKDARTESEKLKSRILREVEEARREQRDAWDQP